MTWRKFKRVRHISRHNLEIHPLSDSAMFLIRVEIIDDDLKDIISGNQISTELDFPARRQSLQVRRNCELILWSFWTEWAVG